MSSREPPTLLKLAMQSLLRNEALASSASQELPWVLIPTLLKEALAGRHMKILTATVAAWPFPCLPVGALMKNPDMVTLKAVLGGVDMQLKSQFRPRGRILQVLNLRNVDCDPYAIWAAGQDGEQSADTVCKKQDGKRLQRYALRQRLKVVTDLCLEFRLEKTQTFFLQWAQQRRDSLQLCCVKMQIMALSWSTVREILEAVHPECIEELEVDTDWGLSTLACFARHLGQMRNLRKLSLRIVILNSFRLTDTPTETDKRVPKFISQFSNFNCLQDLSLVAVRILRGHMQEFFQCLKTPLESLSISLCKFSQSDLESLAQCQSLCQLRNLELVNVFLARLSLRPLRLFLERVAGTLQTLHLENCKIEDPQLSALLPALSQCSQLRRLNFIDNDFSLAVLRDLLHHTANLSQLVEELYPAPLECYAMRHHILADRFVQLSTELMDTLRTLRQPQSVSFASKSCIQCRQRCVYNQQSSLCACWR